MDDDFLYDVAFSFLGQDESLAVQLNDLLKDRLVTFIYSDPERQRRLAGGDGAEAFSRVFGTEARTVVVLYREGWGERGFTLDESNAIRDRPREHGWDFATFIPLDKPPKLPPWLPKYRLWIGLERWGLEHAAAVIESRVREAGGTPKELTLAEFAAQAKEQMRQAGERAAFLNSSEGVAAAWREFDSLFEEASRVCQESSGFLVRPERSNRNALISVAAPGGSRSLNFVFELQASNSLVGSKLNVIEFDGTSGQSSNHRSCFHFDFGPSGEHGWREGEWGEESGKFFRTSRLMDDRAMKIIAAIQGKTGQQGPFFRVFGPRR